MMKGSLLPALLLMLWTSSSQSVESAEEKSPAFGAWRGFSVGTYIIEKHTYRGAKYHADGVEYRKTVLADVGDSGAAKFQDYTSENVIGPWKISTAHGDVAPRQVGKRSETKFLDEEILTVGARTFRCAVSVTVEADDWGKVTTTNWTDKQFDLVLRQERQQEGQDRKGQPSRWTSNLVTTGMEKRSVAGQDLECFVQEHQRSPEIGGQWSRTWATSKVPQRRVAMVSAKSKSEPFELEVALMEWGRDVSLLGEMKEASPLFAKTRRQQQEEEERKRKSQQMENEMVANLASGVEARVLSGINAVSQWADIIPAATKAAAVAALSGTLEHFAVEVRRAVGGALGKLGVKGLSSHLAASLRRDPEGVHQYLEALGMQADMEALKSILPSLSSTDENHRRAAVLALRYFKESEAIEAVEKALTDPSSQVRFAAVEALEKIADPRCVPALTRVLRDENSTVVSAAIRVTRLLGDDSAVPPLLDLLESGDNEVRAAVCIWIGKMRLAQPSIVGDAMLPLLDDPDSQTRFGEIAALGAIREKRAVPRLLQIIKDPVDKKPVDFWIRPQAIALIALGQIGDPSAIGPLAGLLDVPELGESVAETLMMIGDPAAAPLLFEHYVRTADDEKFWRAHRKEIEALGKLGTAQTRAALESYLATCPPPRKRDVRQAISEIDARSPR